MEEPPALQALQLIWNAVYPDKPYTINGRKDPVFRTARQKTYDWRNKFSSTANILVKRKLKEIDGSENKQTDIMQYVKSMLAKGYPFVLKYPEAVFRKPFQSELVAACFAVQLRHVRGAVDIPELAAMGNPRPIAALTLATLACYHALDTFSSGLPVKKGQFSGSFLYSRTEIFTKSILGMSDQTWTGIMEEASKHVSEGSRRSSAKRVKDRPVENMHDDPPLIVDDPDTD